MDILNNYLKHHDHYCSPRYNNNDHMYEIIASCYVHYCHTETARTREEAYQIAWKRVLDGDAVEVWERQQDGSTVLIYEGID